MGKTLRELHYEIQDIMELTEKKLKKKSSKQLLKYSKDLKLNKNTIDAEKLRYPNMNNIQANIQRRIVEIDFQIERIIDILNFRNSEITNTQNSSNKLADNDNPGLNHPFKDEDTFGFFNFIVEKWDYKYDQKWADIWNELNDSEKYKTPYKNAYEEYIRKEYNYYGKFQYEKRKKESNRNLISLKETILRFNKKK